MRAQRLDGATLRGWRRVQRWRQEDAAAWAGVTVRTWSRWETGALKPPRWLEIRMLEMLEGDASE